MTEYSDVPRANDLHQEQERVGRAIEMIDAGGTVSTFTVAPVPPDPEAPPGDILMPAMISTAGTPFTGDALASTRAWLVTRSAAIDAELAALGVTGTPARRA